MRIGMLVWSYWPEPEGGAERQCRLLVRELTRRGHACAIYASCAERPGMDSPEPGLAPVVERMGILCPLEKKLRRILPKWGRRLGGTPPFALGKAVEFWLLAPMVWLSRLSFLAALWVKVRRGKPPPVDVLHVHESGWLAGVGVHWARRWNIPVLIKESTSPALGRISYGTPLRRTWDRRRREADGWGAQTPAVRRQLEEKGIPARRIHLIPNGVEIPPSRAWPDQSDSVVYVGNLTQGSDWKAFDVLFAAWIRVAQARPTAQMTFVGAGDPAPWVRMLQAGGLAHTVRFVGRAYDAAPHYASAGIFVLPSRVEGMSNALLEAQSWGLACVVSDIPGNCAVVRDGVNGLVVPVGDAASLAAAIRRLLEDAGLRRRLGDRAREQAMKEYGIDSVAERLLHIYGEILSAGAGSGSPAPGAARSP